MDSKNLMKAAAQIAGALAAVKYENGALDGDVIREIAEVSVEIAKAVADAAQKG